MGFGVASLGTILDLQAKQSALRWRMLKGIICLCNTGFTWFHWVQFFLDFEAGAQTKGFQTD